MPTYLIHFRRPNSRNWAMGWVCTGVWLLWALRACPRSEIPQEADMDGFADLGKENHVEFRGVFASPRL